MALEPTPPVDVPDDIEVFEPICAVFRRRLKAEGQKYTPERAQILDAIIRLDAVFEAEDVQNALREGGHRVSKATVYRTIRLMQDAGIIQRVLVDQGQAHYQLAFGPRPGDLIVRMDTSEVIQIDVPELSELRDRICREHGLSPRGHRFHIYAVGPARSDS